MTDYIIIWAPKAKITYYKTLQYLDENWTERELSAFIHRTEEAIKYIRQNPLTYPHSKINNTYKCLVVRQVSLFYRLKIDRVELLIFWDNRQNPAKLKL